MLAFAFVGVLEDVEALGERGHHAVLDSVVHHFDEVAGAGGPAMEKAFFGGGGGSLVPAHGADDGAAAGCERAEDGMQPLDRFGVAADHEAVAALESPYASADAGIEVMEAAGLQFLGAANIVGVIRIAAVNDGIVGGEQHSELLECGIHYSS